VAVVVLAAIAVVTTVAGLLSRSKTPEPAAVATSPLVEAGVDPTAEIEVYAPPEADAAATVTPAATSATAPGGGGAPPPPPRKPAPAPPPKPPASHPNPLLYR
jgi:hypothetical protein